jgi:hypothetical protein
MALNDPAKRLLALEAHGMRVGTSSCSTAEEDTRRQRQVILSSFWHSAANELGSYSFSGRLARFEIRTVSNEDADIAPDAIVHGLGDGVAYFFSNL